MKKLNKNKRKIKINKKKIFIYILIPIIIIMALFVVGSQLNRPVTIDNNQINDTITNEVVVEAEIVGEETQEPTAAEVQVEKEYVKKYTTTGVNLRVGPGLDSNIIRVLPINTEIQVFITETKWAEVKEGENIYYIHSDYISDKKTELPKPIVTSRGGNLTTRTKSSSNGVLTKSKGVNYFNGHKETWYSQKVLPGGRLKIPGRHVAEDGTIRDKDNYICVASSDYTKGTIVETSLGTGKVYDCGCASGTIDIYTNW